MNAGPAQVRVAVAQLAYHPAALVARRSPLEEPLFAWSAPDSLLPEGGVSPRLSERWRQLRARIRNAYDEQLLLRLRAVLATCRSWQVRLLVLPEYSVPWEILAGVAGDARGLVVVAGTHAVDRQARRSGIYARLGWSELPASGSELCPVLAGGRIVALAPKHREDVPGQGEGGFPHLDPRPGGSADELSDVLAGLDIHLDCAPRPGKPAEAAAAREQARSQGRPVLYANAAAGGGTAIYAEGLSLGELRRFPEHAGHLEVGDEGLVVADLDLGGGAPRPFACASLLYAGEPSEGDYAAWLQAQRGLAGDLDAFADRIEDAEGILRNAGAQAGGARERRLNALFARLDTMGRLEELRRFLREVPLPRRALPLPALRAALAEGAADELERWQAAEHDPALGALAERLRAAAREGARAVSWWHPEAKAAFQDLAQSVRSRGPRAPDAGASGRLCVVKPTRLDPAGLGEQQVGELLLSFRAHAHELRPEEPFAPEPGALAQLELETAQELSLLARAEGAQRLAAVRVRREGSPRSILLVLFARDAGWQLWHARLSGDELPATLAALSALGISPVQAEALDPGARELRVARLLERFRGARSALEAELHERLRGVRGQFVEPSVRTQGADPGETPARPIREALESWLQEGPRLALLLGEFGSGRTTALVWWARQRHARALHPLPLVCALGGAGAAAQDPLRLLLASAGVADTPAQRAALRLLIERRLIVPCFDGFDELATRLEGPGLAAELTGLLAAAGRRGRVLISSRDHFFASDQELKAAAARALERGLGAPAELLRLRVQPFSPAQVDALIAKVLGSPQAAEAALARMRRVYDLLDLVPRPLLLGMVLGTLEHLREGARVGTAELYEAYLDCWLAQTRTEDPDAFSDAQKKEFAEALAEELWRSGQGSCSVDELQAAVRRRLSTDLPDDVSRAAAFLEIQGGAFFVRDGADRYRFAHKSFLEYFLARSLARTLPERPAAALGTEAFTPEVVAFVREVLRGQGESPASSSALQAARSWLKGGRARGGESPAELAGSAPAAANALRLLLQLGRLEGEPGAFLPEEADLRAVRLAEEDLSGANLGRARLAGADLSGAVLDDVQLRGADLRDAVLQGATLQGCLLADASLGGANLRQVAGREVDLRGADLRDADLSQSSWVACDWSDVRIGGTRATALLAIGSSLPPGRPLALSDPRLRALLRGGHAGAVFAVGWDPRGQLLASAGQDGSLRVWDPGSARELARLVGAYGPLRALAWDPAGQRLAAAGLDGVVRVWDPRAARLLRSLACDRRVRALAWAPGRLAVGGQDGYLVLWDPDGTRAPEPLRGHEASLRALAWDGEGRRLVSADAQGAVCEWDAETRQRLRRLEQREAVHALALHPAGEALALGREDGRLILNGPGSHAPDPDAPESPPGGAAIRSAAWSPGGEALAVGDAEGVVRVLAREDLGERLRLGPHRGSVWALAWDPRGGRLLSAGTDGDLRVVDAESGRQLRVMASEPRALLALAWARDGELLACGGADGRVRVWETRTGRLRQQLEAHRGTVWCIAGDPRGERFVSAGTDGCLRLWDAASGAEEARCDTGPGSLRWVAWDPGGARLAACGAEGALVIWDPARDTLSLLEGPERLQRQVAWDPSGELLACAGSDGELRVWDVRRGEELRRFEGHMGTVHELCWDPAGERLASAGADGTLRVWDARRGWVQACHREHEGGARAAAWSPDGRWLASVGDAGGLILRGPGESRQVLGGGALRSVAWSPDGRRVAVGARDGSLTCFELPSGRVVVAGKGHRGGVLVRWSPDGSRLASCAAGGVLRLWQAEGRGRLLGHCEANARSAFCQVPAGWLRMSGDREGIALGAASSASSSALLLPLGGCRTLLEAPKDVAAALRGEATSGLRPALASRGWSEGKPWDGAVQLLAAEPRAAPVPRALPPAPSLRALPAPVPLPAPGEVDPSDDARPLGRDAALAFLCEGAQGALELEPSRTPTWIVDQVGSRPYALQAVLSALLAAAQAGNRRALIQPEGVRELVEQELPRLDPRFRVRWEEAVRLLDEEGAHPTPAGPWLDDLLFLEWVRREQGAQRRPFLQRALACELESLGRRAAFGGSRLRALAEILGMRAAARAPLHEGPAAILWLEAALPHPTPLRGRTVPILDLSASTLPDLEPEERRSAVLEVLRAARHLIEEPFLLVCEDEGLGHTCTPEGHAGLVLTPGLLTRLCAAPEPQHHFAGLLLTRDLLTVSPYRDQGEVRDPAMFYGRGRLLRELLSRRSFGFLLVGPRRIGKSTVLRRLETELAARRGGPRVLIVDLLRERSPATAARRLARRLGDEPPALPGDDVAASEALVAWLEERSRAQPGGTVLLLDETDALVREDAARGFPLLSGLRSLQAEQLCSFILAGSWYLFRETLKHGSPLLNFATVKRMSPLEPHEAEALASEPMARLGLHYEDPGLPARIAADTGGYPNVVQALCDELLERLRGQPTLRITAAHLEAAETSTRIQDYLRRTFSWNTTPLAKLLVYGLLDADAFTLADAQDCLRASCGEELPLTRLDALLTQLDTQGLVREEGGRYTWTVPLLRECLRAQDRVFWIESLRRELGDEVAAWE